MSILSFSLIALGEVIPDASWKTQDTVAAVVGIVVAVLTTILVVPVLKEWRERRKLASQFGGDFFLAEDIANATRCYVRPHCSEVDLNEIPQAYKRADEGLL